MYRYWRRPDTGGLTALGAEDREDMYMVSTKQPASIMHDKYSNACKRAEYNYMYEHAKH